MDPIHSLGSNAILDHTNGSIKFVTGSKKVLPPLEELMIWMLRWRVGRGPWYYGQFKNPTCFIWSYRKKYLVNIVIRPRAWSFLQKFRYPFGSNNCSFRETVLPRCYTRLVALIVFDPCYLFLERAVALFFLSGPNLPALIINTTSRGLNQKPR